jgi:hypothetical protein
VADLRVSPESTTLSATRHIKGITGLCSMKLYVTDEDGRVVFDFSDTSGGYTISVTQEQKIKIIVLVTAALKFLLNIKNSKDFD